VLRTHWSGKGAWRCNSVTPPRPSDLPQGMAFFRFQSLGELRECGITLGFKGGERRRPVVSACQS
jgi:hypothetical protein